MARASADFQVVVIGGGVVGASVAYMLARRRVRAALVEAQPELALGASGTNSGILHTGFDSVPGELETRLILRSAALRDGVLEQLGVPVVRCGALVVPHDDEERRLVAATAAGAAQNGVPVERSGDGSLGVAGESVTDPVAYTRGLAAAAAAGGVEVITGAPVEAIARREGGIAVGVGGGDELRCAVAVNCAGLHADEVARAAGDDSFSIYPRKGEFFVFEPSGERLERILLPVPTKRTKGVLVFPTVDGKVVAGPTAHDQEDKHDWTVRPEARGEVMAKAVRMLPSLEGAEPVASYAGLRPAGRDGANYVIGPSAACAGLVNVAAIRSTGLSASLGIGEHVTGIVGAQGVELAPAATLGAPARDHADRQPWWRRAAERA